MLDFLTKLFKRKPSSNKDQFVTNNLKQIEIERQISQDKKNKIDEKKKSAEQERLLFFKKIEGLVHDESALVNLVIHCDFAEGRLQAAQHVYSKLGLETIKNALRNTDKRVVKLMQSRIDSIQKNEQEHQFASACITNAEQLLKQDHLVLNQVIDLDKQVATLKNFPDNLATQFAQLRQQLAQQLEVQQNLQRKLLNITQTPNWIVDDNFLENKSALEQQLQVWKTEVESVLAHEKSHSLPKHLVQEVHQKLDAQAKILHSASAQKLATANHSHQAENASQKLSQSTSPHSEAEAEASGDAMAESTLENNHNQQDKSHHNNNQDKQLNSAQIEKLLTQFEAAIEQGSMQNSRQFERELRDIKFDDLSLKNSLNKSLNKPLNKSIDKSLNRSVNKQIKDRLQQARFAFSDMQSLAKWSADVSRHELIATAQGLAGLSLQAQELVSTVSALRKQWKQLEQTSGGANKELWQQFDTACNNAYAPAAQHFHELDEQRQINLENAEKYLLDMQTQVNALLHIDTKTQPLLDAEIVAEENVSAKEINRDLHWKKIHQAISQFQQEWKKIGLLDRKHANRVTTQFEKTLNQLREPLSQRQQEEVHAREQLIAQTLKIDANQRQAVDQVRALQERWQTQAQQVPLRRQDEQALWDQFRAACDAVFVQRKQVAESNDAQRVDNAKLKVALCEQLESNLLESASQQTSQTATQQSLSETLKQITNAWREIGSIPRDQEATLERRYQCAVQAVQLKIQEVKQQQQQLQNESIFKKMALCQKLDQLLIDEVHAGQESTHSVNLEKIVQDWEQLSSVINKDKWHTILNARFAATKLA